VFLFFALQAQRREVRAWAERVLEVCQKAENAAATSELFYSTWIETLLNLGRVDEAVKTAEVCTPPINQRHRNL
jgi:hypothetical protein